MTVGLDTPRRRWDVVALFLSFAPAVAGVVIEADAGPAFPLEKSKSTETGANLGLAVGYRWSFGPVHLRPEAVARMNFGADAGAIGGGGAVTFGPGIFALGPYAHLSGAVAGGSGTTLDAGALIEIAVLPELFVGARLGWQQDRAGGAGVDDFIATWLAVGVDL